MKNRSTDRERLGHILAAADFILLHTEGKVDDDFYRDDLLKYAILKQIEIIGEAANSISKELMKKYPEVEWREMIGTRHVYVHHYNKIDWVMVWEIVEQNIGKLQMQIVQIIEEI
ncbi:MAG: DUF86 domain-containing protein [Edaphocola sp.]